MNATCENAGSYDEVVYCTECGDELSRAHKTGDPKLGHNWGTPSYEWSSDNRTVKASRVCERDGSHVESETVRTTAKVTKEATLTEPGEHTYTARFTKSGFETQTKTVADIPIVVPTQAPDVNMTVTVSDRGVLATSKDGKTAMLNQPFTAKDINKDGNITVDEALVAVHKKYNSTDGYQVTDYGTYSAVTRIWGVETSNSLFAINDVGITTGVTTDTVAKGDRLSISINKDDAYYADWYTYFTETEKEVMTDESFELTLVGHLGMAYTPDELEDTPIPDAQIGIWALGELIPLDDAITDAEGKVTLSFAEPGTYIVSADGTVNDNVVISWSPYTTDDVDCPIIAPGCVVTVKAPVEETVTVKAGNTAVLPEIVVDGKDITKEAKWESSDSTVVTVYNGKLTAKKAGTATVTATYDGQTYTFPVTVTKGSSSSTGSSTSSSSSSSSRPKPKNTIILTIDNKTALVNGNAVENDVAPFIQNDRTMLPIRFIAETLGATVNWDEAKRQVRIEKGKTVILLTIDSATAYVNDVPQTLDSPAIIRDSRTFLPIRFVAENLGAVVEWNEATRQVTITY